MAAETKVPQEVIDSFNADESIVAKLIRVGRVEYLEQARAAGLHPDLVGRDDCAEVLTWIIGHADRHGRMPLLKTVEEAFPRYLIVDTSDEPLSFFIERWRSAVARREFITFMRGAAGKASDPEFLRSLPDLYRQQAERIETVSRNSHGRAEAIPFSSVPAEAVRWVWPGYIPERALTVVAADPKTGKGLFSVWIAAQMTRGWRGWGERNVAFLGHEDSLGTQSARLQAAGVDLDRVYALRGRNNTILTLPSDAETIRHQLIKQEIGALFIDPINSHTDTKLKANDDKDMRAALSPLALIAQECNCVVIVVHHFSKGTIGGKLLYRLGGSMAYSGVARSVLALGKRDSEDTDNESDDEANDPNARWLFQSGSNYSEGKLPIRFQIRTVELDVTDGTDEVPRFEYDGEDDEIRTEDVFSNGSTGGRGRPKNEGIRKWLDDFLEGKKEVGAQALRDAAHLAGHSDRTVRALISQELNWTSERRGQSYVWKKAPPFLRVVPKSPEEGDE